MTALDSHCPPAPPFDFFLLHHNSTVCLLLQATACAVRSQLRSMPQGSLAVTPKTNDSIITVIRSPCVKTTCIIFIFFYDWKISIKNHPYITYHHTVIAAVLPPTWKTNHGGTDKYRGSVASISFGLVFHFPNPRSQQRIASRPTQTTS